MTYPRLTVWFFASTAVAATAGAQGLAAPRLHAHTGVGHAAHGHVAPQEAAETERIERTFELAPGGALEVSNMGGDIRLTPSRDRMLRVVAVKNARRARTAARDLEALQVDFEARSNRVEIHARHSRSRSRGWVDLDLQVPSGITMDVHTISGDVVCTDVDGEIRAQSVNGDITVAGVAGATWVKSVSGDVEVASTRRRDGSAEASPLTVGSVSGDVVVRDVAVGALEVGTVSGDTELTGIEATRLMAKTVSGSVTFSGSLQPQGRYEFTTHSGDVELRLGEGAGFVIDAATYSGTLDTAFPLTLQPTSGESRRERRGRTIRATFGDGGARIELSTFSGDVTITRR